MDVSVPSPAKAPETDPQAGTTRQVTGCGTPGIGSGITAENPAVRSARRGPFLAFAAGLLLAIMVVSAGNAHTAWSRFAGLFAVPASRPDAIQNAQQLDRLKPQKQAEALLELAVDHSAGTADRGADQTADRAADGAADQISSRVNRWQGKLKWDSQIATLTTAALNSSDVRVRESGIEVELAAYGLRKNSASLEYLLKRARSSDHGQKVWALWALGLMGNRGVEIGRVVQVLNAHLRDSDEDSRRWAIEGLALTGVSEAIPILLQTMHSDPSPAVRERAACGLAESGMFTEDKRLSAVPQLIRYTDDPALDAQTHAWAFQALGDITHEHLPNDSSAWRSWYESQGPGVRGQ